MTNHNHILPISVYIKTYIILMVLMVLTVFVGVLPHWFPAMHELTIFNNMVALGVAVSKATLVGLFFMGVKFSSRLTQLFALLGFIWLGIMFITLLDYFTRAPEAMVGWENIRGNAVPRIKGDPGT